MDYLEAIRAFAPGCEQEESDRRLMLQWAAQTGDAILTRQSELAHFTSSGFIMNAARSKVLLAHHNIYRHWAWTGGHVDGDADFLRVALKEATEETGVGAFTPLSRDIAALDILPVWGHKKHGRHVSGHLHLSVAYLLTCDESAALTPRPGENTAVRWFDATYVTEAHFSAGDAALYNKLIARARALA